MDELFLDIITWCITFAAYFWVKPYADVWSNKIMSSIRVATRIKRVGVQASAVDTNFEEMENENIGLNKKGPIFGDNAFFNFIAERDPELIENMKALLLKAGIRQDNALEEFMRSKFVAGVSVFMITYLLLLSNEIELPSYILLGVSALLGGFGGHKLTDLNYEMIAKKRKDDIDKGVPDLVDLLVICTESGLDLTKSIRRIAREMRTSNPVLADELSLTSIELEMIPDHRQVFTNLENRTDCLEIKTISKTLSQALEYGSSLSSSLKELALESREKRMLTAEGKAAQAPTLLTLPMMFFIMPCLFIVMLGPVIIGMINSFTSK